MISLPLPAPQGVPVCQAREDLLLGVVTYGAGVQHHGVSLRILLHRLIASHPQDSRNHLTVSDIHLAAIGLDAHFLKLCAIFFAHIWCISNLIPNFVQNYHKI